MTVSTTAAPSQRWHELDAVRAFALLLGVALHGAMSFMSPRIWLVDDVSHSTGINVLFYVIHMFRMTTFFVLAGFFARMMVQKKGLASFIGNRLKRVALPLVAFWPVAIAAIIAVAILANMPTPGTPSAPPPPPPTLATFPLTHLWFLYVLLLLYAGTAVIKIVTDVLHVGGFLGRALDTAVGVLTKADLIPAILILPVFAAFYSNPQWLMWMGILTPDAGFVPNLMAVAGFSTAFAFGWWLNRRVDLLEHLANRWWLHGLSALVGTWWCLHLVGVEAKIVPVNGHDHPLYAALYALTGWSWTFFLIGAARRFLKRENPAIRYLADASYWVYLIHIPFVMGLQYAVMKLDWPAEPKAAVVLIGTVVLALVTYRLFVRYSFIGTILNGRKRKPEHRTHTAAQEDFA